MCTQCDDSNQEHAHALPSRREALIAGAALVAAPFFTGKRIWHFQMVHHGLWDYDLPAAPKLIDIRLDGKPVKALAQVSKQGSATCSTV